MSHHTVTAEWEDGYVATYSFRCTAPEDSACHAVYDCDCESYYEGGVEDGLPWHAVTEWDDATRTAVEVRHVGRLNADHCNLREWFDVGDDQLDGALTFEVEASWEGDGYSFAPGPVVQP